MYAECVCVCPIYLYGECVRVRVFGTSGVCQPCVSGQQAGCAARGDRDQAPRLHLCCPGPQSPALWSAAVTSLLASLLLGPLPAHSPLSALGRRHPVRVLTRSGLHGSHLGGNPKPSLEPTRSRLVWPLGHSRPHRFRFLVPGAVAPVTPGACLPQGLCTHSSSASNMTSLEFLAETPPPHTGLP